MGPPLHPPSKLTDLIRRSPSSTPDTHNLHFIPPSRHFLPNKSPMTPPKSLNYPSSPSPTSRNSSRELGIPPPALSSFLFLAHTPLVLSHFSPFQPFHSSCSSYVVNPVKSPFLFLFGHPAYVKRRTFTNHTITLPLPVDLPIGFLPIPSLGFCTKLSDPLHNPTPPLHPPSLFDLSDHVRVVSDPGEIP